MGVTEINSCLNHLHKLFVCTASGEENLQVRIRTIINETAKQPKLNLVSLPLSSLLVEILEHITDQGAKPDTLLLAGTCVVRLLCRFLTPRAASDALQQLLLVSSCPTSWKSQRGAFLPSPEPVAHTSDSLSHPTFYHLCLIHGALSTGTDSHFLLTCQSDDTAPPLIIHILRPLIYLVLDDTVSRYHTVSTLLLWFRTLEHLQREPEAVEDSATIATHSLTESLFTPESSETALVLSAVDANWESSVNGVSELTKKVYQSLVHVTFPSRLAENDCEKFGINGRDVLPRFHQFLLEKAMRLDWKAKPKLLSLACLMQFVPFEMCLKIDANFAKHCIHCLLANHLVSATVDVYKASLTFGSAQMASKEIWSEYWKTPIIDIIKADDGTCLQNMTTHLLPWTLKNVSCSLEELAKSFETCKTDEVSLSFLVTLGRIAMQVGLASKVLEDSLLVQCLVHQSNGIRIEAFSLCCSSYIHRPGTTETDLPRILQFTRANLNVDDSWFRSRLMVQLENVFVALRECMVSEFSKATRQKRKHEDARAPGNHDASAFCFVKDMIVLAIENLFPGSNYQRAITSLGILESLANVFRVDSSGKQRTTHKRETLEKFFASETNQFGLEPMQKTIRAACLTALFHNVVEVRLSAFRLLTTEGCPLFKNGSDLQDVVEATADKYLSSPRPQDNAIGALLVRLYLANLRKEPSRLAAKLEEVCSLGERAFAAFQQDLVSASASCPLHGILFTLTTCLGDVKCILAAIQAYSTEKGSSLLSSILNRAMCLAKSSLLHALQVMVPRSKQPAFGTLSASSANRVAPSFEDTNLAFAELIRDHELAKDIKFTPEQCHQVEERMTSFCWHCIKNSCSLLELVAAVSLKDNGISYPIDAAALHDIADTLVAVMTGCRHRGAIESCCESLRSLCHGLSSNGNKAISGIPFNLLKNVLLSLTLRSKSSSVTRRSAGLPLLIRALLEGEAKNVKQSMAWTVDLLSRVIRECSEQPSGSVTTVDLPQAEALHVLCAIVSSASLGPVGLMHLGRVLQFCFEALASPFWIVRNAAHQLYGVTAPRVLGLKKTREEFVGHDALSALDLFARFPDLRAFFLDKLDGSNVDSHDLYFVLDFLSRLKPPASNQQHMESLEPFQQCIRNHLGCRSWNLRLLAAKCISSFCLSAFDEVVVLLTNVAESKGAHSHNRTHAQLHAANRLLRNNQNCIQDVAKWFQETTGYNRLSWALSSNFFVRVEVVNLFDQLFSEGDSSEWLGSLHASYMLAIAKSPVHKELPGDVMWRQRQTRWLLRRAEHLCPSEVVTIVRAGTECAAVMEPALDFLLHEACRPDSGVTSEVWCQVAVTLVAYLNTGPELPVHSAEVLELLEALLRKPEVASPSVDTTWLAKFKCIALNQSFSAGTTVRALSLVVWSLSLKHCLENVERDSPDIAANIDSWLLAITSAVGNEAKLAATADIHRLHAARSLRIVGSTVFDWAAHKCGPQKLKHLQSLFRTVLQLLQDEDPQIRSEAAGALPLQEAELQQLLPVQANVAADNLFRKMLLATGDEAELVKFLWGELCRSSPSIGSELKQLLHPTVGSLFEQDESGVFMEPAIVSLLLRRGTEMALEAAMQREESMTSFLLREATILVDELKVTSQALNKFVMCTGQHPGSDLQILGSPKLYHAITLLQARVDLIERAYLHVSKLQSPSAFSRVSSSFNIRELLSLHGAATELSLAKVCVAELWAQLTFTK
ncbi:tRNA (32-2'-O)-methyltransferase regulator THADA isoform X1 [Amblyomma americanum]